MFYIPTRTWRELLTDGDVPAGREGHASWVIDDYMFIYGGSCDSGPFDDVMALHIPSSTWSTIMVLGDHPGHRESMGNCQYGRKLYIFGGNTSLDT